MEGLTFLVHVKYNKQLTEKREEVLIEVGKKYGYDREQMLAEELIVSLGHPEYNTWYASMLLLDPYFAGAHHCWDRGEYFTSPKTGDQFRVTIIT
jgi:hypothetical protein